MALSGLGGWQVGDNAQVTLTMVADFPAYSTDEVEGEEASTTEDRQLIITEPAPGGSTAGLSRNLITNDNSSGDWRGLIWARETRDYSPDETALPVYGCPELTRLGGSTIGGIGFEDMVISPTLTAGWQAILGTFITEIIGGAHMTHRGGRRVWMRVEDPNAVVGNVQLRLIWRALGSSRWTEDNAVVTVPVNQSLALVDLGSVLPQQALTGDERWEGKVMARALNGSGKVYLLDFLPLPTEQYIVMSDPEEATIDGSPVKTPGTVEDNSGVGSLTWSNVNNAKTEDGTTASVSNTSTTEAKTSHYLKLTNFGFAIPTGAVIKGITAKVRKRVPQEGTGFGILVVTDDRVRIVKGGAIKESEDKSTGRSGRPGRHSGKSSPTAARRICGETPGRSRTSTTPALAWPYRRFCRKCHREPSKPRSTS